MSGSTVFSFDLDDTLVATQKDYDRAREDLAEWLVQDIGVEEDIKDIKARQKEYSKDLYSEYGISLDRFPKACERAYKEMVDNHDSKQMEKAREIGQGAYLSEDEYRERGFMEGAEEALNTASEHGDMILVTAGVESLQQKKIYALELQRWFGDDIHIVRDKSDKLGEVSRDYRNEEIYHIGNSWRSDVEPALEAGITPVHVRNGEWRGDVSEERNEVISMDSLAEFPELITELNSRKRRL